MEADYTVTAANACRQMSLPLTYDNGINLFRKNCETETAYFMCEVKGEKFFITYFNYQQSYNLKQDEEQERL